MSILDTLEPDFREKVELLIAKIKETGLIVIPTSGRRTVAEQNKLYAQGRTVGGKIVTNAKGGQSPHNFGLAVDLAPVINGKIDWDCGDDVWNLMHRIGEEMGLRAGYDFKSIKDSPHYEDPDWKLTQLAWKEGKIHVA